MKKLFVTGLGLLLAAAPAGAEDAAPARTPARREYSGRVQMHDVTVSATPVAPEEPRVKAPETLGLESAFMPGLFVTTELLMNLPPPAPPASSKRAKREQNWLLPSVLNVKTEGDKIFEEERRESGWGWLADDVHERREADSQAAAQAEDESQDDDLQARERAPGMLMDQPADRRLASSVYDEVGVRDAQDLARVDGREDARRPGRDNGDRLRTRVSALEDPEVREREASELDPAESWRARDRKDLPLMPRTAALFSPSASREPVSQSGQSPRAEEPAPVSLLAPSEPGLEKPAGSVYEWGGAQPRAAAPSGAALPGATPASTLGKSGSLFGSTPVAPPAFGVSPMPSYSSPGFQAGKPAEVLRPWGSTLPAASPTWLQPANASK